MQSSKVGRASRPSVTRKTGEDARPTITKPVRPRKTSFSFSLDGQPASAAPSATILDVCMQRGIPIPTLCWSPRLSPFGGCRVCLVEHNGEVVAGCSTPPAPGSVVRTATPLLERLRRNVVEMLLSELPAGTPPGELQALARQTGASGARYPGTRRAALRGGRHPDIQADGSQCVLCQRCVRACEELAGPAVFAIRNRGMDAMLIAGFDNAGMQAAGCTACGLCVDECPTGALQEVHFSLFRAAAAAPRVLRELCGPQVVGRASLPALGVMVGAQRPPPLNAPADPADRDFPLALAANLNASAPDGALEGLGLHPDDARAHGIEDGCAVEACGLRGSLRARAVVTARVPAGMLWLATPSDARALKLLRPVDAAGPGAYAVASVRLRRLSPEEAALPPDDALELRAVPPPGLAETD